MPGFNINNQGGDPNGPSNTQEVRRKHRWIFESIGDLDNKFLLVLKESSRPSFKYDEAVMHHNQEEVYFAGKQKWDEMKLIWYDVEQSPDCSKACWDWLNKVTKFEAITVAPPAEYKKDAVLKMVNGAGKGKEKWNIYGCWPKEVNWQTLDYSNTEIMTIDVSMRYDRAVRG